MDRINRRRFFGASAAAAGSLAGASARGDQGTDDQGNIALSRPHTTTDDSRDPLGLSSGKTQLTPDIVNRSIEDGVRFLKSTQLADGTWPNQPHYDDGLTPLATLALLHAGCSPTDPSVARALEYLAKYVPRSTYTASLQTMVFCVADAVKYLPLVMRNAKWIESRQWQKGTQVGMWSMSPHGSTDHTDNSMSHFAILALYEAERIGVRVRPLVWQLAVEHWRKTQNSDGSWGWGPNYPGSGSMTCAGIAALVIGTARAHNGDAEVRGDEVIGCGVQAQDPELETAQAWLERGFSVSHNPGTDFWHSYYLYALERAGRMTSQRFIGKHDWYREGARRLVETQEFSGAWPSDVEFQKVEDKNVSTSFSLMFLSKGRWPVVVSHLKHAPATDWNRHRRAMGNLVSHVEQSWGRNLTYQIVDIDAATVEDLRESPVLFLNGRDAPQLSAADTQKLRQYVDRGGFLFVERCCGGDGFDRGFRQLARGMFPEPEHQLRLLPPEHPVWFADGAIDANYLPPLWGIDVGCRTAVIYCPQDVSAYWELDSLGRERNSSEAVQGQMQAARQVGMNVIAYATGREVEFKNPAYQREAPPLDPNEAFDRGKLYAANVLHPGGCHAAPAALTNLLQRAASDFRLEVSRVARDVELTSPDLFRYHVLFMHGRTRFSLTQLERERLREYLERGGTLIADAICSSPAFAGSFQQEMRAVFPTVKLQPVPASDPIFSTAYGGADISTVTQRRAKSLLVGKSTASSQSRSAPVLEAIQLGDRYAVLFSPLDLSCSLETEPVGCPGYLRRDALQIAINLLMYSLNQ